MTSTKKRVLISAAMAGLMATAGVGCDDKKTAESTEVGKCLGVNSCKGKADCHGHGNSCGGQNSCKGKGWKKMQKDECIAQNGEFIAF